MKTSHIISKTGLAICSAAISLSLGLANAKAARPANLGSGLDKVLDLYQQNPAAFKANIQALKWAVADEQGRVVVDVHLSGTLPLVKVREAASKMGGVIVAELATYNDGVFSVFIPASSIEALAAAQGVSSVILCPRPYTSVGSVTAQGAVVHHTDQVNTPGVINTAGVQGSGISIGILSDSYDKAKNVPNAAAGVASGDLPGTGNPDNSQPVVVLKDIPVLYVTLGMATDEGRGMAEIVHDLAPKAKISFATAYSTDVDFANNIRALRTSPKTRCDVIVDDVGYATEPMFSDGIIAQAVDDVATSTTLAGKKVAYFSSAGNAGSNGYSATFKLVTWQNAQKLTNQNIQWSQVPKALYQGGFHNFDPGSGVDITQTITPSGGDTSACFQWDDPFDKKNGITTDYNLLVFDVNGNYLPKSSLIVNNFTTNEPVEYPLTLKESVTYQIAICRSTKGTKKATRLRYVERAATLAGEYFSTSTPTTYGHDCSANANGVAAYVYDNNPTDVGYVPALESFSSNGPVVIAFDSNGNRLATPITRLKPDFAAADGQDTSFFPPGSGQDYDNDGFPNFFGTSAAAPTAAAIAALVLETAGGPGSLTPPQVSTLLKNSVTGTRDIDPRFSQATVTSGSTTLTVTANGDDPTDPNFFKVFLNAPSGQYLTNLVFNLVPAGLEFDPDVDTGFPYTVGTQTGLTLVNSTETLTDPTSSGGFQTLTLGFDATDFASGDVLGFGIDRDTANVGTGGNSADLLAGATVQATISGLGLITATFVNTFGTGYTYADGVGFIDALKACQNAAP